MRTEVGFLLIFLCLIPAVSHAAAIHDAAKKGDVASISAALDAGADINGSDGMARRCITQSLEQNSKLQNY